MGVTLFFVFALLLFTYLFIWPFCLDSFRWTHLKSFLCLCVLLGKALAAAEVNARRRCRVVAKLGLLHAACSALPEPRRIVDDLDLFAL